MPGIGDSRITGRRALVAGWRIFGVRPVVHQILWADGQTLSVKLARLQRHIDDLTAAGHRVSLVGESAGASMALHAYASRPQAIHRVVCLCGKLRTPQTIHPITYGRNPAFAESMAALPASINSLRSRQLLPRILSIRPLADPVVPPADTLIPGAQAATIPSVGHATSIIIGDTLFSWLIMTFLRRR